MLCLLMLLGCFGYICGVPSNKSLDMTPTCHDRAAIVRVFVVHKVKFTYANWQEIWLKTGPNILAFDNTC